MSGTAWQLVREMNRIPWKSTEACDELHHRHIFRVKIVKKSFNLNIGVDHRWIGVITEKTQTILMTLFTWFRRSVLLHCSQSMSVLLIQAKCTKLLAVILHSCGPFFHSQNVLIVSPPSDRAMRHTRRWGLMAPWITWPRPWMWSSVTGADYESSRRWKLSS